MAKFPILEWKEIDGVNTPFAYPQHKKKDGSFVVTGENNPLPVAGYGMTDNGIWIPKRVNDDGSVNTQLTGSNIDYLIYSPSDNITIAAGSQIVLSAIDFKGSEFGFNLRMPKSRDITVTVQQIMPNAGTMISVWELLKLSGTTFNAREKLRSSRSQFIIVNKSDADAIIHTLAVTDFL